MSKQIYYFSGTGNSLYVAKKIQEQLGDTQLIKITAALRDQPPTIQVEVFGLVFPVYAWGPPVIVEEFLKKATIRKPGYLFVVATHGGGPESALKAVEKILLKQGLAPDSAFDIAMPGNYIVGSNPPAGEEMQTILRTAEAKLADILGKIAGRVKTTVPVGQFPGMLKTLIIHPLFAKFIHTQDKKFLATEKCTGCGICAQVCAVQNISLNSASRPEWQHHCEYCLACINWCPVQAIEYGEATRQRNRYHHPEVKVTELSRK
jgi:ferredoxin